MKRSYDKRTGSFLPYIFVLMFVSGVIAGSVVALVSENTVELISNQPDKMTVFTNSFKSFLKPCMIIWISGFTGISLYISSLALAYRGGIFGFVICIIFKSCGFGGGMARALTLSLPQNIIYFPFLLFLSLAAIRFGRKKSAGYIIIFALSVLVCALSALIDACITSKLINFTF